MTFSIGRLTIGRRAIIGIVSVIALVAAGAVAFIAAEPHSVSTTSIWGNAKPADVRLVADSTSVELGTAFTPAVDGQATAVRFYKLNGQTGVHTGTIWGPDGGLLASVTFSHEDASGWQTAQLLKPVDLTAGDHYVVSYRVPVGGHYAVTENYSGASRSAFLSVSRHDSGLYSRSSDFGHHRTSKSSQYWADLTFFPGHGYSSQSTPQGASGPSSPAATSPATPTPSASTASPSPSASSGQSASSAPGKFPTRTSAGLPSGWVPLTKVTGDYHVRTAGAVVQDLQITNGTIFVDAPNVTLNRIRGIGAFVDNGPGSSCFNGLTVENSTFTANGTTSDKDDPVIQYGGYTAKNIVIDGAPEGLRVGGSDMGCGPVIVQDSFIRLTSPSVCTDWHGDGIQGYGGKAVTVRDTTIVMNVTHGCQGNAPFFYPKNQGNTSVDIDGLLVGGDAGYPFREGMPGSVRNLNVIAGSWQYNPVDVNCAAVTSWQAQIVTLNSAGQPVATGQTIPCIGDGR